MAKNVVHVQHIVFHGPPGTAIGCAQAIVRKWYLVVGHLAYDIDLIVLRPLIMVGSSDPNRCKHTFIYKTQHSAVLEYSVFTLYVLQQ